MTARRQEKEAVTVDDLFNTTTGGFLATGEEIDRVQRRLGHVLDPARAHSLKFRTP